MTIRKLWAGLATAAALGLSACATTGADAPAVQAGGAPLLRTSYGPVVGSREGETGEVNVFRGVRYAASTEGRRFQRAAAPQPWSQPLEATRFGSECPQIPSPDVPVFASWANTVGTSEDCLFLNVWTRGLGDGKKRPIMVWLHGGGYVTGSGSSNGYDGARLAERGDVVVVTLNHRLNALGYSYLAGLTDDPKYADSGNLGSLDIVRALEWVRDHADAIGGDAGNVTIFGESGGAAKVSTLMAMEDARGLFQRAIAQSGSMSLSGFTPRVGTPLAKDLMTTAGASSVEELAAMPIEGFIAAMMKSRSRGAFYRPVVDGRSLTRQPYAPDANPVSADIPLLVGTNNNEMRLQGGLGSPENFTLTWEQLPAKLKAFTGDADVDEVITGMRAAHPDYDPSDVFFQVATFRNYRGTALLQAERKSAQAAPVYMYRLDWKTPVEGGRLETPHALDIAFVFDNVARSTSYTGPETAETQRMADLMADAWIAFARTGNPNTPALPQWPTYDMQTRATMIFDLDPQVVQDPDGEERELLQRLLPEGRGL
ncbi:carboxylesterase/lipase family protein [Citromicrobium sp. WPS32]|uniref:carboxylesterase/lipase family protein n=1 Tax=Citromicrobium sp. WPS32 TaxID=1634517 RepID=UPI0006C93266|nr:carboxylesterase family protein [Citromicrobium sp. WPS32]KPM18022.1 carboxylesterase [Citromicrobium sp. WPS32]|tara:strand:+ start:3597 stop:5222 length:1626 start_codon:yes stop_codon:yes gene_type:complete